MESLDQRSEGDIDADDAEEDAKEDNEAVVSDSAPIQGGAFQFEMEVARPDEGEHGTSEAADETH